MLPVICLIMFLAACAGETGTPGEALRLLGSRLDEAFVGEPYTRSLQTAGGLRPYTFELDGGTLPPGLSLENGTVRGTPTETGNFSFTVTVSDAALSSTFLEYEIRVSELPPPELELSLPGTEMRAPFTVRASVADARNLRGFSTRMSWDPGQFRLVPGSVRSGPEEVAMFSESGEGWLQVDFAWLGTTYSGSRQVFSFDLEPVVIAVPGITWQTLFAEGSARGTSFGSGRDGARVNTPRPVPPTGESTPVPEAPAQPLPPDNRPEGEER